MTSGFKLIEQYHAEKFVCVRYSLSLLYYKQKMKISHDTAGTETWNERYVKILPTCHMDVSNISSSCIHVHHHV